LTHSETIIRVKFTAVNTEVMMPISSTTANPRIGPEPKYIISAAAMVLVMLASKIAVEASL
jgi:hypothetical protein